MARSYRIRVQAAMASNKALALSVGVQRRLPDMANPLVVSKHMKPLSSKRWTMRLLRLRERPPRSMQACRQENSLLSKSPNGPHPKNGLTVN